MTWTAQTSCASAARVEISLELVHPSAAMSCAVMRGGSVGFFAVANIARAAREASCVSPSRAPGPCGYTGRQDRAEESDVIQTIRDHQGGDGSHDDFQEIAARLKKIEAWHGP